MSLSLSRARDIALDLLIVAVGLTLITWRAVGHVVVRGRSAETKGRR